MTPVKSNNRLRLVFVAMGIFALFSVLIFQFYTIQILDNEKWSRVARSQHYFVVKEPFSRGTFWSNTALERNHPEEPQRFVFDIQKFHLYIDPTSIPEKDRDPIADTLISHLNLTPTEKLTLRSHFDRESRSRKLAMWLSREKRDAILSWWQSYARPNRIARNALYFIPDYQRSYPFGKLLGQVLHTVQSQRDELTKQAQPTGGLELAFNSTLQGKLGKRLLKRSPRHSFETGTVLTPPQDGADIHLTINHYLQAIAEEELEKGVKRCHAKEGWAVMMDPNTGEILALAQYPFFHPAKYREYFNNPNKIGQTRVRAVQDSLEPGSVLKSITLACALLANKELQQRGERPLFDPEEKTPCSNGHFPGRSTPLRDTTHHKYLNMSMALQKSSNIYFARLAEQIVARLGNEWYRHVLADIFGFGNKTGIELPSEAAGMLPTPGKLYASGALEWSAPTPYSLAIGHNLQCNSIQLLRAYALLANGGHPVQPTLVRKIIHEDEDGQEQTLLDNTARPQAAPRLDPAVARTVVQNMKYVTKTGGTGRRADVWGYTDAGKTGTANKIVNGSYSKSEFLSSFIGFAPAKDPAFVLIVSMDEPECRFIPGIGNNHHGSIAAAPVFKEIAKRTLEYLGIAPDDPHGYPFGDPRYDRKLADWVPESQLLQENYEKWNN